MSHSVAHLYPRYRLYKDMAKFGCKMKRPLSGAISRQSLRAVHLRNSALIIILPKETPKSTRSKERCAAENEPEGSAFDTAPCLAILNVVATTLAKIKRARGFLDSAKPSGQTLCGRKIGYRSHPHADIGQRRSRLVRNDSVRYLRKTSDLGGC